MIVSLWLAEFGQLGSAALSGHGEVRRPIFGLRAKILIFYRDIGGGV